MRCFCFRRDLVHIFEIKITFEIELNFGCGGPGSGVMVSNGGYSCWQWWFLDWFSVVKWLPGSVVMVNSWQVLRGGQFEQLWLLTFWRRDYFLILAHPVYKMWIIQEPNTLELRNKLHF